MYFTSCQWNELAACPCGLHTNAVPATGVGIQHVHLLADCSEPGQTGYFLHVSLGHPCGSIASHGIQLLQAVATEVLHEGVYK